MRHTRYNREHVQGHVPAVRALLQHDITPCVALCVLVSAVHIKPQQQPQRKGDHTDRAADHDLPPESVSLELSDGWYSVAAQLDETLALLALEGKLKVCLSWVWVWVWVWV